MSLISVPPFQYPSMPYLTSAGGFTLDAAGELITYIIQIPKTGTLKKIGWRVVSTSSPVMTCRVSIETLADAVGVPVATTDADKTLYATGAVSADITSYAAGPRFDSINGSTGIAVTKGDSACVTIRVVDHTSGNISAGYSQYSAPLPMEGLSELRQHGKTMTYTGGSWSPYFTPYLTLEYDGEFVPMPYIAPCNYGTSSNQWNSSSSPDRRGMKFVLPYTCTARGAVIYLDNDVNTDLIIYDADGYTVMSGFPITIDKDRRVVSTIGYFYIEFPTEPQFTAGSAYRMVLLPKDTSNITAYTVFVVDDSPISGLTAFFEGGNIVYTTFSGVPTSGSHAWSDDTTRLFYNMGLIINQIDIPSGSGGGLITHPGMNGGCNA